MNDPKWTKGPWCLDPDYPSEVQTIDLSTVATCWHEHAAGETIKVTGVLACSLEESAANARLIASAPTLYEALVECVAVLERIDTVRHADPNFPALDNARRAIAKATGATP